MAWPAPVSAHPRRFTAVCWPALYVSFTVAWPAPVSAHPPRFTAVAPAAVAPSNAREMLQHRCMFTAKKPTCLSRVMPPPREQLFIRMRLMYLWLCSRNQQLFIRMRLMYLRLRGVAALAGASAAAPGRQATRRRPGLRRLQAQAQEDEEAAIREHTRRVAPGKHVDDGLQKRAVLLEERRGWWLW